MFYEVVTTCINRIKYKIEFSSIDKFVTTPEIPDNEVREKVKDVIWNKLVAPRGPNFRGRKAKQWK